MDSSVEREAFDRDVDDKILSFVASMGPRYLRVFVLRNGEGRSFLEIGEELGVTSSRVVQMHKKCVRKIRHVPFAMGVDPEVVARRVPVAAKGVDDVRMRRVTREAVVRELGVLRERRRKVLSELRELEERIQQGELQAKELDG